MRERLPVVVIVIAVLLAASPAQARLDPLAVITEKDLRAEVLIVLDTSGSMAWYPNPSYTVGSECSGDRKGTVDLCGDGLCSGSEGTSSNSCQEDCAIASNSTYAPGSAPMCNTSTVKRSRMFMLKRVLQGLLPEIRRSASLGMVTFKQDGYYRYYPEEVGHYEAKQVTNWVEIDGVWQSVVETVQEWVPAPAARKVTIFLTRAELENRGGWDETTEGPADSFAWNDTPFTLLSKAGLTVTKDSLYMRADMGEEETRFSFATAGQAYVDSGYTWRYAGSYYTYEQKAVNYNSPSVLTAYKGPQFVDDAGQTWIYHRFNGQYEANGITASSSGMMAESLTSSAAQGEVDKVFHRIMGRLNHASNGGIWAWGGTPTGPAIETARQHFFDRQTGSGPFAAAGADDVAICRMRYVLLLTDGQSNSGSSPITAARDLFNDANFSGNPVKILVVGLPGLPSTAVAELDQVADYGDDGLANSSKNAFFADNYGSLVKVLTEAFLEMLKGDYTTTSPGISTSDQAYVLNDMALIPSTEYPQWTGHLRAMDLTSSPPVERWDAAVELNKVDYNKRKLYTGYPESNSGDPVALFDTDGAVNLEQIKQVWTVAGSLPTDAEITTVVEWLAGKGKEWKLGPIFRSAPATVGSPPAYNVTHHHNFRSLFKYREKIIYITSNDGILHAFRSRDGTEAFGFVPPNLWPQIYALWKQGGQDPEPSRFKWLLASSPRVEDIPPAAFPSAWRTHLMLGMGPGGEHMVGLDVTDPSTCTAVGCTVNEPPFTVVAHTKDLNLDSTMGETWSVPTYFFGYSGSSEAHAELAVGSGYGSSHEGHHYNRLAKTYGSPSSYHHGSGGATVEFAVLAGTAAAVDMDNGRKIVATYQADLNGRVIRYGEGDPDDRDTVISAGAGEPFYFSPALLYRGNGNVLLAAVSGSDRETEPAPNTVTTLFLRSETGGVVDTAKDHMTCKVTDICSQSSGCPQSVPEDCTAPTVKAKPVNPPLLFRNSAGSDVNALEAYFLLYDPADNVCGGGYSWLLRFAASGDNQELVSIKKYAGIRATGMSVVGDGSDLAIARLGAGKEKASVFTVSESLVNTGVFNTPPFIETWKEVRAVE